MVKIGRIGQIQELRKTAGAPVTEAPSPVRAVDPATAEITVIPAGECLRPEYSGTDGERLATAVHYVSVRPGLIIQGTIADLREAAGQLGLTIAGIERDVLEPDVARGRRVAENDRRQLA